MCTRNGATRLWQGYGKAMHRTYVKMYAIYLLLVDKYLWPLFASTYFMSMRHSCSCRRTKLVNSAQTAQQGRNMNEKLVSTLVLLFEGEAAQKTPTA